MLRSDQDGQNEVIRIKINKVTEVQERRMQWFVHVERRDESNVRRKKR